MWNTPDVTTESVATHNDGFIDQPMHAGASWNSCTAHACRCTVDLVHCPCMQVHSWSCALPMHAGGGCSETRALPMHAGARWDSCTVHACRCTVRLVHCPCPCMQVHGETCALPMHAGAWWDSCTTHACRCIMKLVHCSCRQVHGETRALSKWNCQIKQTKSPLKYDCVLDMSNNY